MNVMGVALKGCLCATVVFLLGIGAAIGRPASAGFDFSQELVSVVQHTAVDFSFSQAGFSEGAGVTGTFTGSDLDLDGQLSSFEGEILAFSMTFSGNSIVPTFSLGLVDLFGLVYDLDGGPLGDGTTGGMSRVLAQEGSISSTWLDQGHSRSVE
jgi:hypothetical protein